MKIAPEWYIFIAVTVLKLLLVPTYHSTDFEVHRNWMAITYSLPMEQWYTDETSQWTLDYPPFFAWCERFLAQFAVIVDPNMLQLSNLNYASFATVLYQRTTVMAGDALLFYGIHRYCSTWPRDSTFSRFMFESWSDRKRYAILFVTFTNAGLLIVDHIHFQYNGFLLGFFLLSVFAIRRNLCLLAAVYFSTLLNLKHIFLYVAPLYFVYLLSYYCFIPRKLAFKTWEEFHVSFRNREYVIRWTRFGFLGFTVILMFATSLFPIIAFGQIPQLLSRLFPFGRGLTHAYWAPNIWALYNMADIVLTRFFASGGAATATARSELTRGLVGEYATQTLPQITPMVTFALTIIAMLPILYNVWKKPHPKLFLNAAIYTMLCSFMCGYHVHEKAILMVTIPLSCISLDSQYHANFAFFFTVIANATLIPLIPNTPWLQELVIKNVLILLHTCLMFVILNNEIRYYQNKNRYHTTGLALSGVQWAYLSGFIAVELFHSVIQPFFFARWEFLPLMLFSCYGAVGCCFCWWKSYRLYHDSMNIIFG